MSMALLGLPLFDCVMLGGLFVMLTFALVSFLQRLFISLAGGE